MGCSGLPDTLPDRAHSLLRCQVYYTHTNGKKHLLLVAHRHVVEGKKKHEGVLGVLVGLDLLEHRLGFLEEDERLLVTFLGNEVDGAFIQFVNYHGDLVFVQVKVLIVVPFK